MGVSPALPLWKEDKSRACFWEHECQEEVGQKCLWFCVPAGSLLAQSSICQRKFYCGTWQIAICPGLACLKNETLPAVGAVHGNRGWGRPFILAAPFLHREPCLPWCQVPLPGWTEAGWSPVSRPH